AGLRGGPGGRSPAGGSRQAIAPRRSVAARSAALPQRRGDRLVVDERLERYVTELFAVEDPVLARVRARHAEAGLPAIHISPDEGKLLHVLLRAIGARRVLELGALGGYRGIWLAPAVSTAHPRSPGRRRWCAN